MCLRRKARALEGTGPLAGRKPASGGPVLFGFPILWLLRWPPEPDSFALAPIALVS